MSDLTPERRAELRGLAESAQPVIRYGGTDPAAVYVPATDLAALLDAADEADRLQDELAWEKRQHESRMAEARESHERFLRDAHRVSDAYNTVARRVYRAAMKRRKTVRIADLLDGQPMVWPDGDE